ncbi:hypothetical protein D9M72_381410 [compost metagenome]
MGHGGHRHTAVRGGTQLPGDIVADRNHMVGTKPRAQPVADTVAAVIIVLCIDDARPAQGNKAHEHDQLVVGRTVDMDDIEAPKGDEPPERPQLAQPAQASWRVVDRRHLDACAAAGEPEQTAGPRRRHRHFMRRRQTCQQVDDIRIVPPTVSTVEVREQHSQFFLHRRHSFVARLARNHYSKLQNHP